MFSTTVIFLLFLFDSSYWKYVLSSPDIIFFLQFRYTISIFPSDHLEMLRLNSFRELFFFFFGLINGPEIVKLQSFTRFNFWDAV